ncbi:hypothetical protein AB6A40_001384 [Gnathostoma spinigerum]|uniref:Uncharacterized protein n=1 Tax=Gnathostoma spinigerum TaxID=75299 RepID=A0ABD6E425_9BILA
MYGLESIDDSSLLLLKYVGILVLNTSMTEEVPLLPKAVLHCFKAVQRLRSPFRHADTTSSKDRSTV